MFGTLRGFHRQVIVLLVFFGIFLALFGLQVHPTAAQSSILTVTPLTWNIIGLDSNSPTTGPQYFPVAARVCNTSGSAMTNVLVELNWTTASAFIDTRTFTDDNITIPSLAAGTCYDAYFEVEVDQVPGAYGATREYTITATSGAEIGSTPAPRELVVERLISQNRNATTSVLYGTSLAGLTAVAPGGTMSLFVDETYFIRLVGSTATQGYEQLEAFLTLSNTIFQINSVSTTYSADSSSTVPGPNPSLYANGCNWENDPNSPNYLACLSTGKAGGSVTTTYEVTILSGGGTTQTLNSLLYDFSGSSFHYNADFSVGARFAAIIDPSSATIAKSFTPASISPGGVSTLTFTLGNPNGAALSGYTFTDTFPANVFVATPATFATSGCGTPTFAPVAGANNVSFSNGTVAAGGTCTITVQVTSSTVTDPGPGHLNTTNNLFVGAIDTGNTASSTLNVTNAPIPPTCTAGFPLATWTFDTGTATNPTPATGSGTATAGAGMNNVAIGGTWSATNISNAATLNTALNEYFEFTIDTTGLTSVNLQFQALRSANGARNVQIYYGSPAPTTASTVFGPLTTTLTTYGPTTLNGVNSSGTTVFRIYAYNTTQDNNGHGLTLDNVSFTGCGIPTVPTLTKAFAPTAIGSSGTSTLTFTLTNPNTWVALTQATFSDTLPTGMTISGAASTTCTGSPSITATIGTGTVSISGATIPINSSCTVTVPVTSSTAGPATNISGFISTFQTGQNSTSTGSATATLTVLAPPQISKQFAANPVLTTGSGGFSTLTFTITNPNQNNAISSVAFTDNFPGGLLIADAPTASTTCTSGVVTANANTGAVSMTGATIAAGGSCTVSVRVDAVAAGNYANTSGNVTHVVNALTFSGNTATDTLTVNAPNPSITVLKQAGTTAAGPWVPYLSVATGSNVFYLITIENTGDVALSPVTVTDPTVSTAGCTWTDPLPVADVNAEDHIDTCVIGPIAAVDGVNSNTVTANIGGVPPVDTSTAIYATTALTIVKTANPLTYTAAGEIISYSFLVTNSGFATLSGPVTVTDDRSTDETCPALTTIGDGDNFFDPGEAITCTATYTITAGDVTAGSVTNTAFASSGGTNSLPDDATVTGSLADLSVAKAVSNSTPTVGSNITFTVTVANAGPSAATGVSVTDQLPAGYTFVSDTPSQGTYDEVTGIWTVGTINSGANATLDIVVTVLAAGPYANYAQVTTANEPDPDSTPGDGSTTDDDDDTNTPVPVASADLSLTKAVSNSTPLVGSNITFTVTVANAGPSAATGVSVTDQLPAGYTFVSDVASQGAYDDVTGIWTVGTINSGANATLDIVVTVLATGPYANYAQVSAANESDPDSTPGDGSTTQDDDDTNTPVPVASADLSVTKAVSNSTPTVGSNITFTVTVANAGPSAATGVSVTDQLPAGYTFVSDTPSQGAYDEITGIWTVGTINSGANATLDIVVTVLAAGPYANYAQVTTANEPDPDSTPNDGSTTDDDDDDDTNTPVPVASADLSVAKAVSNSTPTVGSNITFTVTVANAGPSAATGVSVTDQLPAGYTFVSDTPSQGTYDEVTGIWTVGTINSGGSANLQITVTVNATGPYANYAQVTTANENDPDSTPGDNSTTEDDDDTNTPVPVASADLSVAKAVSNSTPTVGSNITFTVTVANAGPSAATGVSVTDQLPAGYTFVSDTPSQGTYDEVTGIWTVGTINSGANATLDIVVTVLAAGPYANYAQVTTANEPDPDSTPGDGSTTQDDDDTNTPVPVASADLSVTKAVSNSTPTIGSNITFTVTVANAGPSAATGVSVTDQLPAGYTFVSELASQGTYDEVTGIWTVGTINSGANATLDIVVTVNAAGPYANYAQVTTANEPDPDSTPGDNSTTEDDDDTNTPVPVASADLSVAKAVSNSTPTIGSNITFTVTVANAGPSAATGVSVTDQLPAGYTYVSDVASQGTYDEVTGIWTVGTINSGANATLDIVVTVLAAGPYANYAQVTTSNEPDPDSTPNDGSTTDDDDDTNTPVPASSADLSVAKAVSNSTPTIGSNITFTVTVANAGPSAATGVSVTDQLPAGYTFVSDTPSQGTYDEVTGIWTVGTINSGANATLDIVVTVLAAGPYANYAQVTTSNEPDPDSTPGDGSTTEDDDDTNTPVPVASADLSVTKTVSNSTPTVGSNITFTVTVANAGPSAATGVSVTDQLPAGYTFVSDVASQGAYDDVTGIWTVGTINSGANATLDIVVTVLAAGPYANYAQVTTANEPDPDSTPGDGSTTDDDDDTNTPVPVASADLSVAKAVSNSTPTVGSNITFTVTVANAGPSAATGVSVTDQLPAGYTFVSELASQGTYDEVTGIWTVGTINSGANATLDIVVTVNAAGPYANYAQVTTSNEPDPDSTPNDGSTTDDDDDTNTPVPASSADLSVTKTVDNSTPTIGSNITFTVTVANAGPSAATGVSVTDQLPAGYTYVSDVASQGTYDEVTGIWTVGTINSGANATLDIVVTVNAAGPYANYAQVTTANEPDPDSTPNDGSTTDDDDDTNTPVPASSADLSVTKTVDNSTPTIGSNITFTVTVANAGPSAATGVSVTDQLPAGYTYVSDVASQGTYDEVTGIWTVGTINSGANATLDIVVTVNAAGPYANYAQVTTANEPDPDSTPNDGSTTDDDDDTNTPVPASSADLSVTKTVDNSTPTIGSNITFTVTVANAGPSAATGVSVTDQLPAGYTFVSDTPSQGAYDEVTGIWTVGTINSGANATLDIVVTVNAAGPYANYAQVTTANEPDPDSTPGDNSTTEDDDDTNTPVPVASADLSVAKAVSNSTPTIGSNITFTVTVANAGPSAATGVSVTDQLPAGYTYVSDVASQGAYDEITGIWTVGTINSGANATLDIVVTVLAAGPYANYAQVTTSNEPDPDSTPNDGSTTDDDDDTNTPVPASSADLSVTKTVDNSTPTIGSNITFTVTVANAGPSAATGVSVTDQLPAGYTYVSDVASQGTYDEVTGIWTVGTINSGANATLDIVVTVLAAGPYANYAQVTTSNEPDPDSTPGDGSTTDDDDDTNTPVPAGSADLSVAKAVSNSTPTVGSNITFTVTVANAGPSAATGVSVTDQLPAGYTFVSDTPSQGTYDEITGIWTVGTINSGANATLDIVVTVLAAGPYANYAQVTTSNEPDPDSTPGDGSTTDDDDDTNTPVPAGSADLSVTKTVDNSTPTIGSNITFTVTVANAGPSAATGVSVTDQLPAGYTFVSDTPSQGTYDEITGIWTVGTINSGANATLDIVVTVLAAGPYANYAQVTTSNEPDPDSTPGDGSTTEDDDDTNTPTPAGTADLSLTKTVSNSTPTIGSNITFTITVSNAGATNATNVTVTDQLPAGYTFVSDTPSQGTYDEVTGIWTVGTINSGANATLQITVTVLATGPYANTAQVTTSDQPDPDSTPGNNDPAEDDQATNTPTPGAVVPPVVPTDDPEPSTDGSLILVFDPAMSKIGFLRPGELGLTGEQVEWFFTVTNIGTATGTNIVVSDTMRSELRIDSVNVSSPLSSTTSGQTVTVTIPSLAPGQTVNFSVVTTVISGGGQIDNTACLTASNYSGELCVTAPVITSQPQTGESPWWYSLLLGLAVVTGIAAISGSVWMFRRRHYA